MDLNPVEWSQAQGLLLKLVQVLNPLTERPVSSSFFLNKRFFIPPPNGDFQTFSSRHPVRLLTTLHFVQKQVTEWIGEESSEPLKAAAELKKESLPAQRAEKGDVKPPLPISKQAQKLIDQVQNAIGKLCSSANIQNLEQVPLREALRHLKPSLDRIIEAVTYEGMHSASDGPPPVFRFPMPRSPRDQFIKKLISLPEKTEPLSQKAMTTPPLNGQQAKPFPVHLPNNLFSSHQNQNLDGGSLRSVEQTSLPGAPFTPDTRSLSPARRKKKRKGFWFRDEEDRNNS